MIALPDGYFWEDCLALGRETAELSLKLWPNYLCDDSDIPEDALTFEISPHELARRFPNVGIRRKQDGKLVAYLSAVLIEADLTKSELPNSGCFAIESAYSSKSPNCVCLTVANVDPDSVKLGFSQMLLEKGKELTLKLGYNVLLAPVRPTRKCDFPSLPMQDYLDKRSEEGEVFDPWIRTHLRAGAKVVNICASSVVIKATLPKWRSWVGLPLDQTGNHLLPGGLAPLEVNVPNNIGVYCEPNVWMRYDLTQ